MEKSDHFFVLGVTRWLIKVVVVTTGKGKQILATKQALCVWLLLCSIACDLATKGGANLLVGVTVCEDDEILLWYGNWCPSTLLHLDANNFVVLEGYGRHFAFSFVVLYVHVGPNIGIKWIGVWFAEFFFNRFFGHAYFDGF